VCTLGLLTSGGCVRQERCTFSVRQADSSADLRAAAFLRALSFYSYPDGRSPWAQQVPRLRAPALRRSARLRCRAWAGAELRVQAHRRMKTNAEWAEAESKLRRTNALYKGVRVTTFLATLEDRACDPVAARVRADLDASCKLPADGGAGPWLVIGTLDVNQGPPVPQPLPHAGARLACQARAAADSPATRPVRHVSTNMPASAPATRPATCPANFSVSLPRSTASVAKAGAPVRPTPCGSAECL